MPSVILFRPVYDPERRWAPTFPWGLMYLSAILVERGVDVSIVDAASRPDYHDHVMRLLAAQRPVAVGITTMTGDQIRYGLEFARLVRKHSTAAIVWGGVHPSLLPAQTVLHELVDYAVAGEGDYAFAELVACLARNGDPCEIPGVYVQHNGKACGSPAKGFVDLAQLPEIPYELLDVERYITKRPDLGAERYFEICTSRGCPHHCGFCYIEAVHGCQWRALDAEQVVDQIKRLVKRFSLDCVLFREDNFFVSRQRVERIARRLIEDRVRIKWAASCRIDYFERYTPDFIDLLRQSGCALLTFGVESGADRVRGLIRKEMTNDAVLRVARQVEDNGIRGSYHFMAGFPGETTDELLDTCRLIEAMLETAPTAAIRDLAVFTPYPGTGLAPECTERGYREPDSLEGWTAMDWVNAERPWLTPARTRLIRDAQFLVARLNHPNPALRAWVRARWRQFIKRPRAIPLPERQALALLRRARPRARRVEVPSV